MDAERHARAHGMPAAIAAIATIAAFAMPATAHAADALRASAPRSPADAAAPLRPLVKSAPVGERTVAPTHTVREGASRRDLWLDESRIAVFPAQGSGKPSLRARTDDPGVEASAVFVDRSGRPRALPGGVIVTLGAALDHDRATSLLRAEGLDPTRRLGPRMWLVGGPVGIGSLELAERIADIPGVEAAEPNWWAPPVLK